MRVYDVELLVSGPISVKKSISFNTDKELALGDIFRSDISITKHLQGILISSSVYTADSERAYKVALLFVGQMLDVLSIKARIPLNITRNDLVKSIPRTIVRTIVEEEELQASFDLSREVNLSHPKFSRALNWYRKGLYTEDPFDRFLALWNSISVVAAGYHTPDARTSEGIINQIWNCFVTLWGQDCINWEYINGDDRWVNDSNGIRNNIAHGLVPVDANSVEEVIAKIDTVQKVAYKFITQWAIRLHIPLI